MTSPLRGRGAGALATVPAVLLALLALGPAAKAAEPSGTLSFSPATGLDSYALTAVSTGTCSDARGSNLQLRVSGPGFADDTNVTPNLPASLYPIDPVQHGYDVPLQDTLRDFAAQQHPVAVLSGRYEFTLICKKPVGQGIFGTYTGALWFSSPTQYRALTGSGATPAGPFTSPATGGPATTRPATGGLTTAGPTSTGAATRSPAAPTTRARRTDAVTPSPTTSAASPVLSRGPAATATPPAGSSHIPHAAAPRSTDPARAGEAAAVTTPSSSVSSSLSPAGAGNSTVSSSAAVPRGPAAVATGRGATPVSAGWLAVLTVGVLVGVALLGLLLRRRRRLLVGSGPP